MTLTTDPKRKPFVSGIEIAILFTIVFILVGWIQPIVGLPSFWTPAIFAAQCGVLAIGCEVRHQRIASLTFSVLAIVLVGVASHPATELLPMQKPVRGASFTNAPLSEVLTHMSKSKLDYPGWRFQISTSELSKSTTTLMIPDGARLCDALNLVADATDTKWDWQWHKNCGSGDAICASITFHTGQPTPSLDCEVMIDKDLLFDATDPQWRQ